MTSPPDAGCLTAQSRVSLESRSNASATSTANGSCGAPSVCDVNGAGKQSHVLPAAEPRRSQRPKYLEGRTSGEERYRLAAAPLGLTSVEDELKIALCVEEEAILKDVFMVDREASVEMPSGKFKDLPPPPTTQAEVERSPFRKVFEYFQKI